MVTADELSVSHIDGLLESGRAQEARCLSKSLLSTLALRGSPSQETVDARRQFIAIEENLDRDEMDLDFLSEQYELLFTDYLQSGDKAAAATTLLHKAFSFKDGRCWESLEKLVSLFYSTSDPAIQSIVLDGLLEQYRICSSDDADFFPIVERYVDLAWRRGEATENIVNLLLEADEAVDLDKVGEWIEFARRFLTDRGNGISADAKSTLRSRVAARLLDLGRFEECIHECSDLLMHANESETDYLLWCGEAYFNLEQSSVADMFLREVVERLSGSPNDERFVTATRLLGDR